ncbi:MAG TPA: DUF58 domain-containing protein, partial [Actinomycetota bacterium]|nr:DUF58 domain-containing protein [Actinomycetota bacterium]
SQALVQLGYALIILLIAAIVVVRLGRHELRVGRKLMPERARPGEPVTTTIRLDNEGRGSAPLLLVEDRLPPGVSGRARFAVHGIERGGYRETNYTMTPARRGRYQVGPLDISVVDPFGMARLRTGSPVTSTFLVHPPVERLSLPREPGDRRSIVAATSRNPTGTRGEDFYTLREYVEGDDLRKIHWPSTAKRDRYMIRQEETPWHTRATILLDDSSGAHDGSGPVSSFERAVSAAASLVEMYHRVGYTYRLTGAVEPGLPAGRGKDHHARCMDLLAVLEPGAGTDPLKTKLMEIDATSSPEAALLLVAGSITTDAAHALAHSSRRFRQTTVLFFPGHRFGTEATKTRWERERHLNAIIGLLAKASVRCIALGPDESLVKAWSSLGQSKSGGGEGPWGRKPELV